VVSAFLVVKFLHVLLAIVAVGANATYGLWIGRASRDPSVLPFALRGVKILDDWVANPAYLLLFVTGVIMVEGLHVFSFEQLWLRLGVALWALALVLGYGVYTPTLRRQIAVLEAEGVSSPRYRRLAARGTAVGILLAVVVVVIVFVMVAKPA
jgi:uncharacterized membrane protein